MKKSSYFDLDKRIEAREFLNAPYARLIAPAHTSCRTPYSIANDLSNRGLLIYLVVTCNDVDQTYRIWDTIGDASNWLLLGTANNARSAWELAYSIDRRIDRSVDARQTYNRAMKAARSYAALAS